LAAGESAAERALRATLARTRVVQEFSMARATLRFTQLQQQAAAMTTQGGAD
jgi:hypothetical protein